MEHRHASHSLSKPTEPSRHRWPINWNALLCIVCILGASGVWFVVQIERKRIEQQVVAAITQSGGKVTLRGDHAFQSANDVTVQLSGINAADAALAHLQQITWLKSLALRGDKITDASLEQLQALEKVSGFHSLGLFDTQVTEAGLAYLKNLSLRSLLLGRNRISQRGLAQLADLVSLKNVTFHERELTDADLVHLKGLTQLETLHLFCPQVTDQGVDELRKALPNCEIKLLR